MKKLLLLLVVGLTLVSCTKENIQPNYPTLQYNVDFAVGRYNFQGKSGMGMVFRCESPNMLVHELAEKKVIFVKIDGVEYHLVKLADYGYDIVKPTTPLNFIEGRHYTFVL